LVPSRGDQGVGFRSTPGAHESAQRIGRSLVGEPARSSTSYEGEPLGVVMTVWPEVAMADEPLAAKLRGC
jgi:hypothetical protein